MIHHVRRIARRVAGLLLLALGIVGLIMPILPGWLFIIPGAVLLGFDIPKAISVLKHLEQRYPRHERHISRLRRLLHRYHPAPPDEPPA